jgi:hypothetical protein
MDEITLAAGLDAALDSLLNNRLVLLAGAGLSMAPPSSLRSAARIADAAKSKYDAIYGETRAPLATAIEEQANFFFRRGELDSVYFLKLIDQHEFSTRPNPGHYAIADLLLIRALQLAVSTNVDTLIEIAGQMLFGEIEAGIDGHSLAELPLNTSPLLKIHGCRLRDRPNMVWAPDQLDSEPVASRIANSTAWVTPRLLNRDLLVVGYWTDWDYLNAILGRTLGAVNPARVTVVTPDAGELLAEKAPELMAIGGNATVSFHHVRVSGADFLDALRRDFSRSFVRRVLRSGSNDFEAMTGAAPHAQWQEPANLDSETLWLVRRDLEGCSPGHPASMREPPPAETLLGLTLLQLQAAGAVVDGPYWNLAGRRIRVLRAANKALHRVQAEYERETAPAIAPELVIAVGAEAEFLAKNVARTSVSGTITRGSGGRWFTRQGAFEELGL